MLAERPGVTSLANREVVPIEDRTLVQPGLYSSTQRPVVEGVGEIEIPGWREARGYPVRRVVISGRRTNECWVLENRSVDESCDCRNLKTGICRGNRA